MIVHGVSNFRVPLLLLFLLPVSGTVHAGEYRPPSAVDTAWPLRVFADLDSFSVRYDRFYRSCFGTVSAEDLPAWIEIDAGSLSDGEQVLARTAVVGTNEDEILEKLLALVSMDDEIGLTQFSAQPDFSSQYFVLGHRDGSLTLVVYDALAVRDTLQDLDAVRYLAEKGAFLSREAAVADPVVLCRGNRNEVTMWYPRLAREVLHTHTIPGNINPTGYQEFFEGSDRDLIVVAFRLQDPIRRYFRSPGDKKLPAQRP
jgi:hypothetical protein